MSWRENSDEGLEASASGTIILVAPPVANKIKLVFGITLATDEVVAQKIELSLYKKKDTTQVLIEEVEIYDTQSFALALAKKQVLNDTNESIEVVITANPNSGDLHWTAQWGDID